MTLSGLFVPLITPFDATGQVALPALEALARQVLDDGATGLVALGTTAEPSALTPTERRDVLDLIAAVSRERHTPLIVGADDPDQLRTLADRPAVIAALAAVPPFLRPGEQGVLAHFTALAAASPVPLVAYHAPQRTGQPLSAATLHHLATINGVAAVKLATPTIDADVVTFMTDPPPAFTILAGDDLMLPPMLALGAHGAITASAHLATTAYAHLITAWHQADLPRAHRLAHHLTPLSAALLAEPNPTVIKAVLHAHGTIPTPTVRLPLLPATPASLEAALSHLTTTPTHQDPPRPHDHTHPADAFPAQQP